MVNISAVWKNIEGYEGEVFNTKKGLPFTYVVSNNGIRPIRDGSYINRLIPKSDIEKAISFMPLGGPGEISNVVQGSSYVYALLYDKRITHLSSGSLD